MVDPPPSGTESGPDAVSAPDVIDRAAEHASTRGVKSGLQSG
jgi:hypothetical protein